MGLFRWYNSTCIARKPMLSCKHVLYFNLAVHCLHSLLWLILTYNHSRGFEVRVSLGRNRLRTETNISLPFPIGVVAGIVRFEVEGELDTNKASRAVSGTWTGMGGWELGRDGLGGVDWELGRDGRLGGSWGNRSSGRSVGGGHGKSNVRGRWVECCGGHASNWWDGEGKWWCAVACYFVEAVTCIYIFFLLKGWGVPASQFRVFLLLIESCWGVLILWSPT